VSAQSALQRRFSLGSLAKAVVSKVVAPVAAKVVAVAKVVAAPIVAGTS